MKNGKILTNTKDQKFCQNCNFLSYFNTNTLKKVKQLEPYHSKNKREENSLCTLFGKTNALLYYNFG